MKKLVVIFILFKISFSTFSQNEHLNNDSTFSLCKFILLDMKLIQREVVLCNQDKKLVNTDLAYINSLCEIDYSNFNFKQIVEDNHLIKIWKSNNSNEKIQTFIEIKSHYKNDTISNNDLVYFNFLIEFKDRTKNIQYQHLEKQGVLKYYISNKWINFSYKNILLGRNEFYIDNEIDKIILKNK